MCIQTKPNTHSNRGYMAIHKFMLKLLLLTFNEVINKKIYWLYS